MQVGVAEIVVAIATVVATVGVIFVVERGNEHMTSVVEAMTTFKTSITIVMQIYTSKTKHNQTSMIKTFSNTSIARSMKMTTTIAINIELTTISTAKITSSKNNFQ